MNPAETTFLRLCDQYRRELRALAGERPPQSLDYIAFACLMLGVEYLDTPADAVRQAAIVNSNFGPSYLDHLPWRMMSDLMADPDAMLRHDFAGALIHGSSSIRGYAMDLAWLVRERVLRDWLAELLLKNVADTLTWVDQAFALCQSLFPGDNPGERNETEFWEFAERFTPPASYENQYQNRLKDFRANGCASGFALLYRLDADVRKCVLNAALLPPQHDQLQLNFAD